MLDINFIKENKGMVEQMMKDRNVTPVNLDRVIELYSQRKEKLSKIDELRKKRNIAAENRNVEEGKELKQKIANEEAALKVIIKEFTELMCKIPNLPTADTPKGKDESENVVLREWGKKPNFSFKPKSHWEIGEELGIIDTVRGAKVTSSRFNFLKGDLVKLQFAIISMTLRVVCNEAELKKIIDKVGLSVSSKPFIPVLPPTMIKPEMLYGMARLDPSEDKFFTEKDNLFMAGSAEHPLGSMHSGETFDEDELPKRYIGYSTAFRREAGSYGKDTRGILRQHQFDKLEFESFTLPENSVQEQDFLVAIQEHLMQMLDIPYRVVAICTGDMGAPDQRQIDLESWMPGQDTYRETHSADLIGGYQARRLNIKVARKDGRKEVVHMNDATVFAMGRILIAIIENGQNEDGTITVPQALRDYVGTDKIRKV